MRWHTDDVVSEAITEGAPRTVSLDGEPAKARPGAFDEGWAETGRYALVGELARGGGGRVAVAVDRKLGRRVALKRPLDDAGGARLEREALVLARLEHPSIVPIHDAGRDDEGSPFYTMKLVDGETLAARLDHATTFDERLALLGTITAIAEAMAYAHTQGVIHRDLKPGNVVIGAFGEVAVIDWGLGKLVSEPPELPGTGTANDALTQHDAVVGTPAYMAPEQASGDPVDRRADVYAIGAMLYHVLAGSMPYHGNTDEILAMLRSAPPPPIETREPQVPRDLAAIVAKAMAYSAADRYASASELADDLRRYQTGRLVAAHHYSRLTRAWRWLRRHQGRVAVATGALALAAAGTVWATTDRAAIEEPCVGLDAPVRAIWNPAIAAPLERTFATSTVPGALASWRTVAGELDARTTRIADARLAACRVAQVGAQSGATLDLRMTCLDRRTAELGNFVGWLATAKPDHAVDGLASLGRVADCDDVTRLHDLTPMPADPAARATIAAIDGELDRASVLGQGGKIAEAEAVYAALSKRAEATGYTPLRARALFGHAQVLLLQTKTPETLALAAAALDAAERAGADRLRADILRLQLHVELGTLQHVDVAAALADQISAIGARVQDPSIVSTALGYRAQIELARDHIPEAIADAEQAAAMIPDPSSQAGLAAQSRLAGIYGSTHHLDDARRILTKLIANRRAVIGNADDPSLANNLFNLAVVTDQQGDKAHALELMSQAEAMVDHTLPVDARLRLQAHTAMASLESGLGKYREALAELAALLPVAEAKLGHDHAMVADIVFRTAETNDHDGHYELALAGYRDALARYTAAKVPLWIAKCHGHIGTVFLEQERQKDALPELEAALATMIALRGEDSPEAAIWRGDIGRTKVGLGDARGAIADLDRALATLDKGADAADRGLYRISLANAHWNLGDKPLALELAKQARALLESAGAQGTNGLADLTAWEHVRR